MSCDTICDHKIYSGICNFKYVGLLCVKSTAGQTSAFKGFTTQLVTF